MKRSGLIISSLALVFGTTRGARAEGDGVLVYGSVDKKIRQVVAAAVADGVRRQAWDPRDVEFSGDETDKITACLALPKPWGCVGPILNRKGFVKLVTVNVRRETTTRLELTAQFLIGDGVPVVVRRWCEACKNDVAIVDTVGEIMTAAQDKLPRAGVPVSPPKGATALALSSIPSGARASVDHRLVGTTDLVVAVTSGPHTVTLEHPDFEPVTQSVTAEDGKATPVAITLKTRTHPDTSVVPGPRAPSRVLPVSLIGVGATALIGGIVAVAMDEDPAPRGTDHHATYSDTGPLGAGMIAGGVIAGGVGLVLLLRAHRGTDSATMGASRATPIVFADRSGGGVGWVGHF